MAIRRTLTDLRDTPDALVLAACSGGADSLVLAAALCFVAPRLGLRAGLVTVDHGLQEGSAVRAVAVAEWGRAQGLKPVEVATVTVGVDGGPEAAARTARYQALDQTAERLGAAAVLLGHTRDDQAETVLLALARGSGLRGLAGMPERRGIYRRPFLDLPRAVVREACDLLHLDPWQDPHNSDPAYTRARVRVLLPELERVLGPGVVANLARTARLAAADDAVLDGLTRRVFTKVAIPVESSASDTTGPPPDAAAPGGLDAVRLAGYPTALRTRVLHRWALSLGCPGTALSARHVDALDALLTRWSGQGAVHLPGGIRVRRAGGRLLVES